MYAIRSYYAKKSETDLKIIEQTIIRVFGQRYLKYAKYFLETGTDKEIADDNFRTIAIELKYKYRLLLFVLLTEMYVHNNVENFKNDKSYQNLVFMLNLEIADYRDIVITSYSIHYTKLYEDVAPDGAVRGDLGVQLPGGGVVVERVHRRGVRRHDDLEAVVADAAHGDRRHPDLPRGHGRLRVRNNFV